jgi:hypothetical protein
MARMRFRPKEYSPAPYHASAVQVVLDLDIPTYEAIRRLRCNGNGSKVAQECAQIVKNFVQETDRAQR